jgi:hypothetical protein
VLRIVNRHSGSDNDSGCCFVWRGLTRKNVDAFYDLKRAYRNLLILQPKI